MKIIAYSGTVHRFSGQRVRLGYLSSITYINATPSWYTPRSAVFHLWYAAESSVTANIVFSVRAAPYTSLTPTFGAWWTNNTTLSLVADREYSFIIPIDTLPIQAGSPYLIELRADSPDAQLAHILAAELNA